MLSKCGLISSDFPPGGGNAGNIAEGHYIYMQDLHALEATATGQGPHCFIPATPLSITPWQEARADHPDQQFVDYILSGRRRGFHIGADRSRLSLKKCHGNLPSVQQHSAIVEECMARERAANRVLGPLPLHQAKRCHASPMGLIPKLHQPGKCRLIVDLSSPRGSSVNNAISIDYCHMHYSMVLDAAAMVRRLGLTFFGIQVDTEAMQLSLTQDKLSRITALILSWRNHKTAILDRPS